MVFQKPVSNPSQRNGFLNPSSNMGFEIRFLPNMGFWFSKPFFRKWVFKEIWFKSVDLIFGRQVLKRVSKTRLQKHGFVKTSF